MASTKAVINGRTASSWISQKPTSLAPIYRTPRVLLIPAFPKPGTPLELNPFYEKFLAGVRVVLPCPMMHASPTVKPRTLCFRLLYFFSAHSLARLFSQNLSWSTTATHTELRWCSVSLQPPLTSVRGRDSPPHCLLHLSTGVRNAVLHHPIAETITSSNPSNQSRRRRFLLSLPDNRVSSISAFLIFTVGSQTDGCDYITYCSEGVRNHIH